MCRRTRINTLPGFLSYKGTAKELLLSHRWDSCFEIQLFIPGLKRKKQRKHLADDGEGGKSVFSFQMSFKCFPPPRLDVWCIYRIQREYLRVSGSRAAFWTIRELRIMQKKAAWRGQEKAKYSRGQAGFVLCIAKPFSSSWVDGVKSGAMTVP